MTDEGFDYGPMGSDGQHKNHPGYHGQMPDERPIRLIYRHTVCGTTTQMPEHCAKQYALNPKSYHTTFCCHCSGYYHVSDFVWPEDGNPIDEPILCL